MRTTIDNSHGVVSYCDGFDLEISTPMTASQGIVTNVLSASTITSDTISDLEAPSYLTLGLSLATPNNRMFSPGSGITVLDEGPGGRLIVNAVSSSQKTFTFADQFAYYLLLAPTGSVPNGHTFSVSGSGLNLFDDGAFARLSINDNVVVCTSGSALSSSIDITIKQVSSSIAARLTIDEASSFATSSSFATRATTDETNSTNMSSSIDLTIKQVSSSIDTTIKQSSGSIISQAVTASVPYIYSSGSGGTWTDLIGNADQASGAGALTNEPFLFSVNLLFFRTAQSDNLTYKFQMPHSWNVSSSVHPHIHWLPCAAPTLNVTQSVNFGFQWGWCPRGQAFPTTWTTGSLSLPVSASMLNVQQKNEFAQIAPANVANNVSAIGILRVFRSGSSAADTYNAAKPGSGTASANVGLLSIDVHYQSNAAGTINEYTLP